MARAGRFDDVGWDSAPWKLSALLTLSDSYEGP